MKGYTIKQLREEIARIQQANLINLTATEVIKISHRRDELLRAKGYERTYLNKNERKQYVDDFLECYINACYDVIGDCY